MRYKSAGITQIESSKPEATLDTEILKEIREIKSGLSSLKQHVDSEIYAVKNQGQPKGKFSKKNSWGCQPCKAKGQAKCCRHCFHCGEDNHIIRDCVFKKQEKGDRLSRGGRGVAEEGDHESHCCMNCGTLGRDGKGFRRCSGCHTSMYCNKVCQKEHWP